MLHSRIILVLSSLALLAMAAIAQTPECMGLEAQLSAEAALKINDINMAGDAQKKSEMQKQELARQQAAQQALKQQFPQCTETVQAIAKYAQWQKGAMEKACTK